MRRLRWTPGVTRCSAKWFKIEVVKVRRSFLVRNPKSVNIGTAFQTLDYKDRQATDVRERTRKKAEEVYGLGDLFVFTE